MSRIFRGGAALALLPLLAQPTAAQVRRPDPVTVAVRIAPADAGPYVLTTAPGVRAVTPAAGQARPGDLPLTFFLSPSIPAGRTRIATLALPRSSVPVWYGVPERRELGLSGPSDAVVTHGRNLLSVTATNRGNVDARVRVRAHSPTLQVRVDSDSARVPAGATTLIALHVIVPGSAQPGTAYEVRVSLATNGEEHAAATTVRVRVGTARTRLPVQVGVLRGAHGDSPLLWASADGWIADSVRLRGTFASRGPWWYGSLAPRGRSLRVSAPGWRFEAGEIDLARPSDVLPWLGGTGLRAEIGRARGWSLAGGWIRMPITGAAAAQVSAGLHGPGLTLDAALLGMARPGVRSLFPTLALSAGGPRARGGLSGGALLTGAAAAPVGSGNAQVSIGGLRGAATASRTAQPADATAELTLSTVATAAVDLRTGAGTSLFATGVGSRAERDSAGDERHLSSSTSVRAGARYRASHLAVVPAIELRTLSREGRPDVTARTAGVAASSTLGRGASVRVDAGWTRHSSADSSFGSPRLSGGLEWRGAPGFLILATGYGNAGTLAASRAPALHGQLVAGLRSTAAAADLDLQLERQRGGTPIVHGTATASLHVGWQSDVLLAVRRSPPLAVGPAWSVALGLRSSLLGIPVPRGDRRPVLFEDLNANGRRDSGERGLPGVPLAAAHGWAGVTDAAGRFTAPAAGIAEPDLSSLGEGWRVTAVTPRAIAAVRLGSLAVRVVFRDLDPSSVERTPRGAAVLVSPRGEVTPAPLDSTGAARWSDLSPGTYRAYHLAPGALPAATPADAAQLAIAAGDEAEAVLLASYQPRRILVRRLGAGSDPLSAAATPTPAPAPPPARSAPRTPLQGDAPDGCGPERGTGTVRPSMTETEVACSLGSPARVSRHGTWSYWFYRRTPGARGAVYDDVVFFGNALVVTAIVREPGRRYDGPPAHGRVVEELRAAGH